MQISILSAAMLAASAGALVAQASIVVPAANAAARGTGGLNTITRNNLNPRTYMLGINASQLTPPANAVIVGLSFRANVSASNTATWPPVDTIWPNYDISIGPAIPTATWTTTFATNFSATPSVVRAGPMLIVANSFANNPALPAPQPNPWGDFYWDFQTPYPYSGGDLGILMSHPGSNSTVLAMYVDYVANNSAAHGVSYSGTGYNVATGAVSSFCIPRVHFGYGKGCPGTNNMTPVLVQDQDITGGGTVKYAIGNGLAGAPSVYTFGSGRTNISIGNGCTLLTVPLVTLSATLDANGRHGLALPVPAGIQGMVHVQSFSLDAGGSGGLTSSNATELTIQP